MADRARSLLEAEGIPTRVEPERLNATCPGPGIFLAADYEGLTAGFNALGARGKPAEMVAEEAVAALLVHRNSGGAADRHLADQLVLPAAIAGSETAVSVEAVTRHVTTNAWVVERFGLARVTITETPGAAPLLRVLPTAAAR